jgi:hypothetical protein
MENLLQQENSSNYDLQRLNIKIDSLKNCVKEMKRVRSLMEREIVRKKQNTKPMEFYD